MKFFHGKVRCSECKKVFEGYWPVLHYWYTRDANLLVCQGTFERAEPLEWEARQPAQPAPTEGERVAWTDEPTFAGIPIPPDGLLLGIQRGWGPLPVRGAACKG